MKFVFVAKHRTIWPVAWLCKSSVKNAGESSLSDVLSRDSFGEGPDDGTQKFSEPSQ